MSPVVTSWVSQAQSELVLTALTFTGQYLHRMGMMGQEVREQELGHQSISPRLQSCLIPSFHGNQRMWHTWPTYVLYVHKHGLAICYRRFVRQLAETLSDCCMSLSDIVRTNRGARSRFHNFWEAVNELCQQRLHVTLRQAAILCLQQALYSRKWVELMYNGCSIMKARNVFN